MQAEPFKNLLLAGKESLNRFYGVSFNPSLIAIGQLNLLPVLNTVNDHHPGAFMQHKHIVAFCIG